MEEPSPSISIEQELSPVIINHNTSEIGLTKIDKFDKWRRITKHIIQFFRFMKISILRTRFIDTINHIDSDYFESEDFNGYETNRIEQDLLLLDDIKRYQEVFNTFLSLGFVWQDKEFRLAKLKANYIYDHYMSISEATNIPLEIIPVIYNRINSSKIVSSLNYLNLFNDAEKFITEKLLMIYMHKGLNCFSKLTQKQLIPIMNRWKGNQMTIESISSFEHSKTMNKLASIYLNTKLNDTLSIEPQYDELIKPNWTYSTDLGFFYNPIREKNSKLSKRNVRIKTKSFHPNLNSMIKLSHSTSNEMKRLDSSVSKSVIQMSSSKFLSRINQQSIDNNPVQLIISDKTLLKNSKHDTPFRSIRQSFCTTNHVRSSHYYRCNNSFNRNILDKKQFSNKVFICKVHSSPSSRSYRSVWKNESLYRMAFKPRATHFID